MNILEDLSGNPWADEYATYELGQAGIPIEVAPEMRDDRVPCTVIGVLGGFTFIRRTAYWVVSGKVPIGMTNELRGHVVRIAADPEDVHWIDSQDGLNLFVETLKKYALIPIPTG